MTEKIYINGKEALDNIHLRSLTFGEGVFETFRYKSALPINIDKHIKRLREGANLLHLMCPGEYDLIDIINEAYKNSGIKDAYIKICLLSSGPGQFYENSKRTDILTIVKNYNPPKTAFKACINSYRRHSESPILKIKSTNYLENILSRREAIAKGYEESIFLNEKDQITEGSVSNIFWYKDKTLYTPSIECGLLPGTTRETVLSISKEIGINTCEGAFELGHILDSEYAFFTNALIGTVSITDIERNSFNIASASYKSIQKKLLQYLRWD